MLRIHLVSTSSIGSSPSAHCVPISFGVLRRVRVSDTLSSLKQVLKKVEVEITSKEDSWAMRLVNFITGARQMRNEGMTRELPV